MTIEDLTVKGPSFIRKAGQAVGGHRVALLLLNAAYHADQANPDHIGLVAGITTNAAILGDDVRIIPFGPMAEPSWNWTPGPIYCGANGVLTQTKPTSGWLQQVATATDTNRIFVDLKPTLKLA